MVKYTISMLPSGNSKMDSNILGEKKIDLLFSCIKKREFIKVFIYPSDIIRGNIPFFILEKPSLQWMQTEILPNDFS